MSEMPVSIHLFATFELAVQSHTTVVSGKEFGAESRRSPWVNLEGGNIRQSGPRWYVSETNGMIHNDVRYYGLIDREIGIVAYGLYVLLVHLADMLNQAEKESLTDLKVAHDMTIEIIEGGK